MIVEEASQKCIESSALVAISLTWVMFSQVLNALLVEQFSLLRGVKDMIHAVQSDARPGRVDHAESYPFTIQ